jgi:hypothetical protein
MDMLAHKFAVGLIGITVAVAGAVAIARSSADTNISGFQKARSVAATCPKFDWPYGCEWRPSTSSGSKHTVMRKIKRRRLYMRLY